MAARYLSLLRMITGMRMAGAIALACLFACALALPLRAEPLRIPAGAEHLSLAGHFEVLRDPTQALTIADVTSVGLSDAFRPLPSHLSLGFTNDAVWLRVMLQPQEGVSRDWWLEMSPAYLDEIALYQPDSGAPGSYRQRITGDRYPMSSRDLQSHHFVMHLPPISEDQTPVFYLRLKTSSAMNLQASLSTAKTLTNQADSDLLLFGLLHGANILMAIIALMFGLWLHHRQFLFYSAYVFGCSLCLFVVDGLHWQLFLSMPPILGDRIVGVMAGLSVAVGALFVIEILELKRTLPKIRILYLLDAAACVTAAGFSAAGHWELAGAQLNLLALLGMLGAAACAGYLSYRRVSSARWFLLAFSAQLTTYSIAILRLLAVLPPIDGVDWSVHAANLVHVLVLGAGLAHRLRMEHQAARSAQASALALETQNRSLLEERIAERTAALEQEADQRRQALSRAESSEHRSRTVLAALPLPVVIVRAKDGRLLYRNEACRTLLALPEVEGAPFRIGDFFVQTSDIARLLAAKNNEAGGSRSLDALLRSRAGREFWTNITHAWLEQDGEACVFATLVDISAHKEHESNLRKAKDAAESADRAKSDFLAMMSHEIRTPMTGIISVASLLMDTPLTPEQQDWVKIITGSGESLLTILNDILDFSKLEQDRLDIETVPFSLEKLLSSSVELMRGNAEAKDLDLTLTLPAEPLGWVLGDPTRLGQIVLNLLGNAIKFTEQGFVAVSIACQKQPGDVLLAEIEIADSGIGIPDEAQGRLFAPFSQADASISRRFGGTGLGLAISRRLAVSMGGNITVSSEEHQGSRFLLAIPFPVAAAPEHPKPTTEARLERPLTILVAEDNKVNALVVQALLSKNGHRVQLAGNGVEAVRTVVESPPGSLDLILMDMQMPEMNGLDATKTIRALGGDKGGIPIIAMTANAFKSDEAQCYAAGMNGYLTKPVNPVGLDQELLKVFNSGR